MKKLCVILVVLLLLGNAVAGIGETVEAAATLSVTGKATIQMEANFASLHLGVSTQADTVAEAQQENAAAITAVLEALKAQGIFGEDVYTSNFNVSPVYQYKPSSSGSEQIISGYQVDNTLRVTVRELSQLGAVADAAIAAGANQSYGLQFDAEQKEEAYDQALALATQDAARKAVILANAMGKDAGEVVQVKESPGGYEGFTGVSTLLDGALRSATPIISGDISVSASVEIVYTVE